MSSKEIGSMRRSSIERLRLEATDTEVVTPRIRSCFFIESDEYDAHGMLGAGTELLLLPPPVLAGDETDNRPVER
jgi:hypothetical protein